MKIGKWSTLTAATALTGIVATAGVTSAATLTETASLAPTKTNIINQPISIGKFDPSLGILNSVTVDFTGRVNGSGSFENTDAQPATVTVDLAGDLSLKLPDSSGTSLLSLSPTSETVASIPSSSSKTLDGLTAEKSGSQTFDGSSFLNLFTGTGNLDFLFSALATSTVKAPGNINFRVNTSAGADIIKVSYNYQETSKSIPETNATVSLGLVAGLGILFSRRRTWKKA